MLSKLENIKKRTETFMKYIDESWRVIEVGLIGSKAHPLERSRGEKRKIWDKYNKYYYLNEEIDKILQHYKSIIHNFKTYDFPTEDIRESLYDKSFTEYIPNLSSRYKVNRNDSVKVNPKRSKSKRFGKSKSKRSKSKRFGKSK